MNHYLSKFCEGAIDWIWRRRSRGLKLIRVGASMLLALYGVRLLAGVVLDTPYGRFEMTLGSGYGIENVAFIVGFLAIILIIYGLFVLHGEQRRLGKIRVIAIELRGLRDTAGDALKDSIPLTVLGRREQILVNIRRVDGRLIDPNEALQQVMTIPSLISSHEAGYDRSDIQFVAGGLAPVPFSFLMGVLLDDESSVGLMDWDRSRNRWRSLDGSNNGDSFAINGMDRLGEAEEIVLSISVSYPTDMPEIARAFAG